MAKKDANRAKGTTMGLYRQPDQYYIDLYDRQTIAELKPLEEVELRELEAAKDPEERARLSMKYSIGFDSFFNVGVERARGRRAFIDNMIFEDEKMDRLVEQTRMPVGIYCKSCQKAMELCTHFFDVGDARILFVFECPQGHGPRRAIYPDGREYFFPKKKCEKCGYGVSEKNRKTKTKIVTTYDCQMCGKCGTEELNLVVKEKAEAPITQEEREKYCLRFVGRKTFMEDLMALADVVLEVDAMADVKRKMESSGADKIKKLTIPEAEAQLAEAVEGAGFIKFQFEKPELKQMVRVPFTVQDPSKRSERDSVKVLKGIFKTALSTTNWRLMGEVNYRLGYLTGALKAFEQDEDLIKLVESEKRRNTN
jgi:hypothetical protein